MENDRITKVHSDHKRLHPFLQACVQLLLGHFTVNHKCQPLWWSLGKDQGSVHWSVSSRSCIQFVSGRKVRRKKLNVQQSFFFTPTCNKPTSLDWALTCNQSIIVHSQNESPQTGGQAFGGEWTLVVKNDQHQIQLACKPRRGVKGEPILPALLRHPLFNDSQKTLSLHCSLSVHPPHPDSLSQPQGETVSFVEVKTVRLSKLSSAQFLIPAFCFQGTREKNKGGRQSIRAEEDVLMHCSSCYSSLEVTHLSGSERGIPCCCFGATRMCSIHTCYHM